MIARREFEVVARQIAADLFRNSMTINAQPSPFESTTGISWVGTVNPTFNHIAMTPEIIDKEWAEANGMTIMIGGLIVAFKACNPRFREDLFLHTIEQTVHDLYNQEYTSAFLNTPEIG